MASIAKRPNGKWEVRYVDPLDGRHRSKSFTMKKDAAAYKIKLESQIQSGEHNAHSDRLTIKYVAKEFDDWMAQRQKDGRIGMTHYVRVTNDMKHIVPRIGNAKLATVDLDFLTQWTKGLSVDSGLTPVGIRRVAQVLKMIFDYAERRKWVHKNPVLQLLAEMRGINSKTIRTFTLAEMKKLLEEVGKPMYRGRRPRENLMLQCFVNLAAFCGMRLGEIIGLQPGNVDFDNSIIHIRTSYSRHDGLKEPKSEAGIRDVGMPRHVRELLLAWMQHGHVSNKMNLMFTYRDGAPFNGDGFRQGMWARLLWRAGLSEIPNKPTFHFHALRHFAASWRIDAGWSLPDVAREMGHRKFDMTLSVYTHVIENERANATAAQALADRLTPTPTIALPAPAEAVAL